MDIQIWEQPLLYIIKSKKKTYKKSINQEHIKT